ncbi:clathrin adaptor, mu subunit [Periconia macrospinosa]|uniref:Clathrin adaptor, mu subunit n=1 Tax=Periconia macrospinosa TaxID=97972 RepID=A0A2V1DJC3_9PLEO|nr:clathrin adaptor, mu subunit [Periconia macrospinosa]
MPNMLLLFRITSSCAVSCACPETWRRTYNATRGAVVELGPVLLEGLLECPSDIIHDIVEVENVGRTTIDRIGSRDQWPRAQFTAPHQNRHHTIHPTTRNPTSLDIQEDMSTIEALYIFDEHNTPLLEHTYSGRPPTSSTLLPLYLSHPSPRPSLIYLPNTNPSTLLYSIIQDQLLFLCPCSTDTEPLQILEFLHRTADALEDFLGAPLLASKVEANYDVVAQLLSEMVDGGVISCTEPNALRDVVEAPNFIKNLLGGVGLPSTTPSSLTAAGGGGPFSLGRGASPRLGPVGGAGGASQAASTVPWRRANVRHTSNEMYVDIVETLNVTLSPSGRPLAAIANGSIAFTAKVSGVPDLQLQLGCPGGPANTIALPVFHPCVRLNRWKDRPGDLSFVPPDGRFLLAAYEVDLLGPAALDAFSTSIPAKSGPKLNIPATVSVHTGLGPSASDFEVKLHLNPRFAGSKSSSSLSSGGGPSSRGGRGLGGASFTPSTTQGTTAAPTIESMTVHVPLPSGVKNVSDLRVSRGAGEAGYAPGDRNIEWRITSREVANLMANDRGSGTSLFATLRGTVVGADTDDADAEHGGPVALSTSSNTYDYDDDAGPTSYQASSSPAIDTLTPRNVDAERKKMKVLMPSCATVSFSVKGWLPSGIKVESLGVDMKRSSGLGNGVTPYKGVKYVCVSKKGVECRC